MLNKRLLPAPFAWSRVVRFFNTGGKSTDTVGAPLPGQPPGTPMRGRCTGEWVSNYQYDCVVCIIYIYIYIYILCMCISTCVHKNIPCPACFTVVVGQQDLDGSSCLSSALQPTGRPLSSVLSIAQPWLVVWVFIRLLRVCYVCRMYKHHRLSHSPTRTSTSSSLRFQERELGFVRRRFHHGLYRYASAATRCACPFLPLSVFIFSAISFYPPRGMVVAHKTAKSLADTPCWHNKRTQVLGLGHLLHFRWLCWPCIFPATWGWTAVMCWRCYC